MKQCILQATGNSHELGAAAAPGLHRNSPETLSSQTPLQRPERNSLGMCVGWVWQNSPQSQACAFALQPWRWYSRTCCTYKAHLCQVWYPYYSTICAILLSTTSRSQPLALLHCCCRQQAPSTCSQRFWSGYQARHKGCVNLWKLMDQHGSTI